MSATDRIAAMADSAAATRVSEATHALYLELCPDPQSRVPYEISVTFGDGQVSKRRIGIALILQGVTALLAAGETPETVEEAMRIAVSAAQGIDPSIKWGR